MINRLKICIKLSAIALLIVALVASAVFGTRVLQHLDMRRQIAENALKLAFKKDQLILYAPFDEPNPLDYGSQSPVLTFGTHSVDGVFGRARLFTPEDESFLFADARWKSFANEGSLAFWMNATNVQRRQRIIWQFTRNQGFGVVVHDGMVFAATYTNGLERPLVSMPVEAGKFTHVALVNANGALSIYRDGRKINSAPYTGALPISGSKLITIGDDNHEPMDMVLDDFAIWLRKLSDSEVSRIANASVATGSEALRKVVFRHRFSSWELSFAKAYYGILDDFMSLFVSPARLNTGIPSVAIQMSDKEGRKMHRDFLESLESGYRVSRRPRVATLFATGKVIPVKIVLDDSFSDCDAISRPAFVVECPENIFGVGGNVFRIFPPETYASIHPEKEFPLPLDPVLARFEFNGEFLGLYVVEEFGEMGNAWQMAGRLSHTHKYMVHRSDPVNVWGKTCEEAEAEFWRVADVLRSDMRFPWSRQDVKCHLSRFLEKRKTLGFGPIRRGLSENDLLGDNPASMYIIGDLKLPEGVTCKSSNPNVLGDDGKVMRPAGGNPVYASLFADLRTETREFKFRIMPESPPLPALFLYFGSIIEKYRRTDFTCQMYPAGAGAVESKWFAAIGGKCGARHRGNSGYIRGAKRSLSLEFPNALPCGDLSARHLVLGSGHWDPTKLRNKLSFDIFRMMGESSMSRHIAPKFSWAEIFVNGCYFGVYETTGRVQDICEPGDALLKIRRWTRLWCDVSAEALDVVGLDGLDASRLYGDFLEVNEIVANLDGKELADAIIGLFDMGNLVDFYLLLNLTGNGDGFVTNHYICRSVADGKWYLVPWDYDNAFRFIPKGDSKLGNRLLESVVCIVGEKFVRNRWSELRHGFLSDEYIEKWFSENAEILKPYMDGEYELLKPAGLAGSFSDDVDKLKDIVFGRLKWMDKNFLNN